MSQGTFHYNNGYPDTKARQRKVHKYYDARYSDQALDIYSQEWEKRIASWENRLANSKALRLNSERQLDNLDFGRFFLAHPVAAFSLWQVLQACYGLDRAVCGTTRDDIESWQNLPPFSYLSNETVTQAWKVSLMKLRERIKTQSADDRWELKVYDILLGVERFEHAFASLRENFAVNLEGERFSGWMVKRIETGIYHRFSMIDQLLEFKENELWKMQAEAEAAGECRTQDSRNDPGSNKYPEREMMKSHHSQPELGSQGHNASSLKRSHSSQGQRPSRKSRR